VCQKRKRRCPTLLAIREGAFEEWAKAETLEQVRACWSRLGGRTTLHRYGGHSISANSPAGDTLRFTEASRWAKHASRQGYHSRRLDDSRAGEGAGR
jgi:hypothetical protein